MKTPLLILLIYSPAALAGRYTESLHDPGDGFEYLFWVPIAVATLMYQKYEKKGFGYQAAAIGGLGGLAFIYFFPFISAIILTIIFIFILIGVIFD